MLVFGALGTLANFSSATQVVVNVPAGVQQKDLLIAVFGFEGVGSGSSPYIDHAVGAGWNRVITQAPSGTGSGLEVWFANWWTGTITTFFFTGTFTGTAREARYRCDNGISGTPNVTATQQQTGDNIVCPSITTLEDNVLALACVAGTFTAPGVGWPAGWTQRIDNARAGTFGNVEISMAEQNFASPGATGTVTTADTASPAGALSSTGMIGAGCAESQKHLLPILGVGA